MASIKWTPTSCVLSALSERSEPRAFTLHFDASLQFETPSPKNLWGPSRPPPPAGIF